MDLDFDASDIFELAARYGGAEQVVGSEMTSGIDRLTIQGEAIAKQGVGVRTGQLRRSIAHQPATYGGGVATGSWGTATPYARWHEEGRGPVVARGKALRFTIGGRTIYRKRVGPAAGRWYMKKSADRVRGLIPREFAAVASRIVARMGG